jgi:UDP-N-acetylglucosamine transferase subunit ALG13
VAYCKFLAPGEFSRRLSQARVIVAHAGMGTILSALKSEKPILVMPRRAALGEQRNDHQLATARHLWTLGKVNVAMDDEALRDQLDRLEELKAREPIGPFASRELIDALRGFIQAGPPRR